MNFDGFTLHISDVPGVVDLRCDACNGVVRRFAVDTKLARVVLRAVQHECRARRNISVRILAERWSAMDEADGTAAIRRLTDDYGRGDS